MGVEEEAGEVVKDVATSSKPRKIMAHVDANSRYGALFLMLLLTFALMGSLPTGRWSSFALLAVESATLIVALVATGARRVFIVWAVVVVTIGIITGLTNAASGSADLDKAVSTISILLILVAPVALVRAVIVRRKVDLETVLAALCLYVMLGLFFGFLFSGIQTFSGNQFFVQSGRGSSSDFLYYSFATMTTVGYGDLTAASAPGRTLSVAEAMLGQLYLVTVVAVLVSNLKPRSRAVTSKGSNDRSDESAHEDRPR